MGTRFLEHEDLKYLQTLALFFDMDSKSFLEANRLCQNELKLRTTEELRAFPGGLNFPFALYVFATIEVFAAAHSGNQNVTAKQVGKFMSHYLGPRNADFQDADFCEALFNVYRNGLAHEGSPKKAGVAVQPSRVEIISQERDVLLINLPPFVTITASGIDEYLNGVEFDEKLAANFKKWKTSIDGQREDKINILTAMLKK